MAIFKLGKRLGKDFDLNINVNRTDISEFLSGMTADASDIRLRRHLAGPQDGGIMGTFLSHIAEGEGLARTGRYYASFNLPKGMSRTTLAEAGSDKEFEMFDEADFDQITDTGIKKGDKEETGFSNRAQLHSYQLMHARRVNAYCNSITLPDRIMETESVRHGSDAPRNFVYDHKYAELTATFYSDQYIRERQYFEMWQKAAFNNASNNYNYYDNYVADMDLFLIGQFNPNNLVSDVAKDRKDVTYGVKFYDMFPTSIGEPKLAYAESSIMEFDVKFSYHKWLNYFINDVGGVQLHDGKWRQHRQQGVFPFLDFLPKPLRRAGRDALENLRRRLPLGKLSNGKLFPF